MTVSSWDAKPFTVPKILLKSQRSFLRAISNLVKASVTLPLSLSTLQSAKMWPLLPQIPQGVDKGSQENQIHADPFCNNMDYVGQELNIIVLITILCTDVQAMQNIITK